ncbi:hypothetical protein BsWGS_09171 [Bradybaena similaris]
MYHVCDRPLKFSDCHGCNVIVKSNSTLAEGVYLHAQGQFITKGVLRLVRPFQLIFEGKGIIKFNAFPLKSQAVEWVLSKQPLPGGCRRVRLNGYVQYRISVPNPGRCVLVETESRSGVEPFTFEAGDSTRLCFDIEYGDIVVHIDQLSSDLTFDMFCCSPHIRLDKTLNHSSATLLHYNPSSLCCLEDAPLVTGATFRLEVRNTSHKSDSGSYFRVCIAQQLTPYENNDQQYSYGSSTHPSVQGRRRLIAHNSVEVFIIRIQEDCLIMSRPNSRNVETMSFVLNNQHDKTLWFEIHKVSLRVWQACGPEIVQVDNSLLSFECDLDDPPPAAPAPPPPRLPARKPAIRQRNLGNHTNSVLRNLHNAPKPAGIHSSEYISELSATNHASFNRQHDSYVSMDNFTSPYFHNCDQCHKSTPVPVSVKSKNIMRQDLLCDNFFDSTPLPSIGEDLITLSSLESLNDNCNSNSKSKRSKNARCRPHYEHPNRIWEIKSSTRTPFSNSKNFREKTTNTIKTSRLHTNRPEECNNANKTYLFDHNQCHDSQSNSSADAGFECRSHRNTFKLSDICSDIDRKLMCEEWVAKVNSSQTIWSSREDIVSETKSPVCGSCRLHHGRPTCGPSDRARPVICNSEINKRDSHMQTSSVWLSIPDDDQENQQHNLDIHIVPVQGQLKCHSYNSGSVNTLVGSRNSFTDSMNTIIDHSPVLREARNGFLDVRKSTHDRRKTIASASSSSFSCLAGNGNLEATLKKTCCCSEESLFDSDSTFLNHDTHPDSANSDGFTVGEEDAHNISKKSLYPSDEITHLKYLAQLENMDINDGYLADNPNRQVSTTDLQPKLCSQKPVSQCHLAASLSPVPITKPVASLARSRSESDRGQEWQEFSGCSESNYNEADAKFSESIARSSQEALTITSRSGRDNELGEQAIATCNDVVGTSIHRIRGRRDNDETIASNCASACLSVGPTIKLPDGIQPKRGSESTDDQTKSIVSASTLPFSKNVSSGGSMNSNCQETTLKKTFCSSTQSFCDSGSTSVSQVTPRQSVNSDGFDFDDVDGRDVSQDSIDSSEEITHLKHTAQLEDANSTHDERQIQELDFTDKVIANGMSPKPCSQKPFSQYYLAGPVSPVPINKPVNGMPRCCSQPDRTRAQEGSSNFSERNYNGADDKPSEYVAKSSQGALSINNESDRENELSEQAIDSEICLRKKCRCVPPNIIESIISNSAAAYSSIEANRILPNETRPKRSETLKRNMDSSPLNKSFK